jgi:hypothetical protein
MGLWLRNRMIAWAFKAHFLAIRLRHWLAGLARPRLGGLDHITIAVHDLEVARQFYCEVPLQLGPPGQASLYFNDPFGNHLELECLGFARPIPVRPPDSAKLAWKAI